MDKALIADRHYTDFFTDIKERIRRSQYDALKAVNKELIQLYWDIGRMIVEKQQDLGWGRSVVEQLSKDIQGEYPGIQGFSTTNLWSMRLFYLEIQQHENLQPLVGEISTSTHLPEEYSKYLPAPDVIAERLAIVKDLFEDEK